MLLLCTESMLTCVHNDYITTTPCCREKGIRNMSTEAFLTTHPDTVYRHRGFANASANECSSKNDTATSTYLLIYAPNTNKPRLIAPMLTVRARFRIRRSHSGMKHTCPERSE